MQVVLNEIEVKKAIEFYLLKLHGLTVQSENIVFKNKQDKVINIHSAIVTLNTVYSVEN